MGNAFSNQNIVLIPCVLRDAHLLKNFAPRLMRKKSGTSSLFSGDSTSPLPSTIKGWREALSELMKRGIYLYFVERGYTTFREDIPFTSQVIGMIALEMPFRSRQWCLVRWLSDIPLDEITAIEIGRALLKKNNKLFRMDFLFDAHSQTVQSKKSNNNEKFDAQDKTDRRNKSDEANFTYKVEKSDKSDGLDRSIDTEPPNESKNVNNNEKLAAAKIKGLDGIRSESKSGRFSTEMINTGACDEHDLTENSGDSKISKREPALGEAFVSSKTRCSKSWFDVESNQFAVTFFAPFLRAEKTALVPWPFGYLGLISNSEADKVASISFVRGKAAALPLPLQQLLAVNGLIDEGGTVIERDVPVFSDEQSSLLRKAGRELLRYVDTGKTPDFPWQFPSGTPFQEKVWRATMKIPAGAVATYAEIAAQVANSGDAHRYARAVGQALGANPMPIVIPCHRVIGANRDLTGFTGGVDIKAHLLEHELW